MKSLLAILTVTISLAQFAAAQTQFAPRFIKGALADIPATCVANLHFFWATDETAGENLYACTSTDTWTQYSGTGGGAGTGDASDFTTVSFSATPTFTVASNTAEWLKITLTGNVTSSTLAVTSDNSWFGVEVCQDGTGGHTVVWPTDVVDEVDPNLTASACTRQTFFWDGTNAYRFGTPIIIGAGDGLDIPCGTAPGTPATDVVSIYCTSDVPSAKNDTGNVYVMVDPVACSAGDFVDEISTAGVPQCSTPAGGAGSAPYNEPFTAQTTVVLDHSLNTLNVIVTCYDGSDQQIGFNTLTVDDADNATVTFASSQTGRCVVNGGSGPAGPQGDPGQIQSLGGQTGATQTITRGAGIGGTSGTDDHSFVTASGEADFLASGALTCGASTQGKAQVHTTPLQYCDNAATPVLQYAAYGTNAGAALTGDSATSFFSTGILESAIGGTGNGFTLFSGPTTSEKTFTLPNASAVVLTDNADVTVAQGGTGLSSGTSGGVPYFSGTTTIASSGALAASTVVLGGGAGAAPTTGAGYTISTAGSAGTASTNMGTATTLSRSDHEHLVPWQVGTFFEATPGTGDFPLPLPVNNQCGAAITAGSVSITALTKGTTFTFNVERFSADGASVGNLFSGTQTYNTSGNNRQGFTPNQNQTNITSTDFFKVDIVSISGTDDFAVTVQGTCENK